MCWLYLFFFCFGPGFLMTLFHVLLAAFLQNLVIAFSYLQNTTTITEKERGKKKMWPEPYHPFTASSCTTGMNQERLYEVVLQNRVCESPCTESTAALRWLNVTWYQLELCPKPPLLICVFISSSQHCLIPSVLDSCRSVRMPTKLDARCLECGRFVKSKISSGGYGKRSNFE